MPESGNFPRENWIEDGRMKRKKAARHFANPDSPGKLSIWTANLTSIRARSASFFCFPAGVINNTRGTDKPMKLFKARNKDGRRRIVIINAVRRSNFRPCFHLKMDPSWWTAFLVTLSPRFSIFWSTCLNRNLKKIRNRELIKSRIERIDEKRNDRVSKTSKTLYRLCCVLAHFTKLYLTHWLKNK